MQTATQYPTIWHAVLAHALNTPDKAAVIDAKGVKALANLPSREELIAKLLGSMNAPIANFVGVSQGIQRVITSRDKDDE